MVRHPIAELYQTLIQEHLLGNPTFDIRDEAAQRGISDPKVISRAEDLIHDVLRIRSQVITTLTPKPITSSSRYLLSLSKKCEKNALYIVYL